MARKRIVKLCPAAEKIVKDIPPSVGLTGDALRFVIERCIKAQRKFDRTAQETSAKASNT